MLTGVRKGSTSSEGGGAESTPNNPIVLPKFKFRKSEDNLVEVFDDFLEDVPQIDEGRLMCVLCLLFCVFFVLILFVSVSMLGHIFNVI